MAGWKGSLLSFVGKAVLVQASFSTIPAYFIQCNALPNKILDNINKVNRNFLWGSLEVDKKMHWVEWNKITKLKREGGLGLHIARGRNLSLLAKLNWRFLSEGHTLWAKVLKSKYCTRQRINSRNQNKLPCSSVWVTMKRGVDIFEKGIK